MPTAYRKKAPRECTLGHPILTLFLQLILPCSISIRTLSCSSSGYHLSPDTSNQVPRMIFHGSFPVSWRRGGRGRDEINSMHATNRCFFLSSFPSLIQTCTYISVLGKSARRFCIHIMCHEEPPPANALHVHDCLGCAVSLCLVVCLTLLASFLLPSASLIKT